MSQTARRVRPAIGVMLDNVDDGYQRAIWAGLEHGAREQGVDVVNLLGGHLDPDHAPFRLRNGIFELVGPECLDGLIVAATVLSSHIGHERLEAYCRRWDPLPMVSLGRPFVSVPSVVCDGRQGMRDLLEHLVGRHGRRRFAFVGGTETNTDSAWREEVLRRTLADKGIPLDERLVVRADFSADRAAELIEGMLDAGVDLDAVVCANDEMAIGVLGALERRAVALPEAISVTGFDDIPGAVRQTLPLTTVRQPTFDLAQRALHVLLQRIRGETVAALEEHPAELVIRRSCGCLSESVQRAGQRVRSGPALAARDLSRAVVAGLGRSGAAASLGAQGRECVEELVRTLEAEVRGDAAAGAFVARLDTCLRSPLGREMGEALWDELLTTLRQEGRGRLAPADLAEARLHQARILLKESARQEQWRAYSQLAHKTQTLQYVIENLIGSFDIPTLLDSMARELPRIGIRRCYLAVHTSPERAYQEARLLLAYDEQGRRDVGQGVVYPARQLLPEGFAGPGRQNLIWQPLVFGEEPVGFIGLSFDPMEDISSLALAQQIRSALKASMMMQEIREKDRLLLTIDRMRSEFVANITHDFRSLVTIIMDSSWVGMQPVERRPEELRELAGIVYEAGLRLKVAIDRLLDLASMDERGLVLRVRRFRPRRYLSELAAFYRPVLAVSGIGLDEELPAGDVDDLYTDPDKVEQILHNLVSNAAKFVTPGRGRIRLALAVRDDAVDLSVVDDGEGIAPERLEGIFVRYNAQKRARRGGSGIGLAFVKELAAYLKGSIAAHSEGLGKGSRFTVTLPRGRDVFADLEATPEEEADARGARVARDQARQLLESSLRGKLAQKPRPASA